MKIGLALGGGGAKGLAHIPVLEAFDEAGVRPHAIAGTSIGAIVGALYAAGKSGKEVRAFAEEHLPHGKGSFRKNLRKITASGLTRVFGVNFRGGAILETKGLQAFFESAFGVKTFEELRIPLKVVAADFWSRDEVVFESGELARAVRASMSLPGLFSPVVHEDRVLVDGGGVNPLPFDLLYESCDAVVAVDVTGQSAPDSKDEPGVVEALFGMFQIMSRAMIDARLKVRRPDLFLRPELHGVRLLDFWKGEEILNGVDDLKRECLEWLRSQ